MQPPLTFSFTPLQSDYIQSMRSYAYNMVPTRLFLIALVVLSLLSTSLYFFSCTVNPVIFFPPLVTVFFILFLFFLNPVRLAEQAGKNERMRSETTWTVDNERVSVQNRYAQSSFDWGSYSSVLETDEHFLLTIAVNRRMFQFLPKRAFAKPADQDHFRRLVLESGVKLIPARSLRLPDLPLPVIYLLFALLFILMLLVTIFYNFRLVT